jgi:hypothetical protein
MTAASLTLALSIAKSTSCEEVSAVLTSHSSNAMLNESRCVQCLCENISGIELGVNASRINSIVIEHTNICLTNSVMFGAIMIYGFLALFAYTVIVTVSRCEIIHSVVEFIKK